MNTMILFLSVSSLFTAFDVYSMEKLKKKLKEVDVFLRTKGNETIQAPQPIPPVTLEKMILPKTGTTLDQQANEIFDAIEKIKEKIEIKDIIISCKNENASDQIKKLCTDKKITITAISCKPLPSHIEVALTIILTEKKAEKEKKQGHAKKQVSKKEFKGKL